MTYKIELTEQDLQILSAALGEIPFKLAYQHCTTTGLRRIG